MSCLVHFSALAALGLTPEVKGHRITGSTMPQIVDCWCWGWCWEAGQDSVCAFLWLWRYLSVCACQLMWVHVWVSVFVTCLLKNDVQKRRNLIGRTTLADETWWTPGFLSSCWWGFEGLSMRGGEIQFPPLACLLCLDRLAWDRRGCVTLRIIHMESWPRG